MNWFEGSLSEAINVAKQNNRIFAIYVEGNDELSEMMTSVINSQEISSLLESKEFVSIRIKSDSEDYKCFVQIYKHVRAPSLFLIGLNGVPVAIINYTSNESPSDLHQNIVQIISQEKKLFQKDFLTISQATSNEVISENPNGMDTRSIKENITVSLPVNLNYDSTIINDNQAAGSTSEGTDVQKLFSESIEVHDEHGEVMDELPQKEEYMTDDDQENEKKEKVINNSVEDKQKQAENENERIIQESKREKLLNELDRQRILREIAQDKEERQARLRDRRTIHEKKLNALQPGSKFNTGVARANSRNETCIQFRKPNGLTITQVFNVNDVMNDLRMYVVHNISLDSRHFDLAVAFPRHVFTPEEDNKTLEELELVPNAVLLILPITSNPSIVSNTFSQVSNGFWYFFSPIGSFLRQIGGSTVRRVQDSAAVLFRMSLLSPALPQSNENSVHGNVRPSNTHGNIHTINNNDDKDDENNVWNGNSTQHSR